MSRHNLPQGGRENVEPAAPACCNPFKSAPARACRAALPRQGRASQGGRPWLEGLCASRGSETGPESRLTGSTPSAAGISACGTRHRPGPPQGPAAPAALLGALCCRGPLGRAAVQPSGRAVHALWAAQQGALHSLRGRTGRWSCAEPHLRLCAAQRAVLCAAQRAVLCAAQRAAPCMRSRLWPREV